jgi:hypothetical protein
MKYLAFGAFCLFISGCAASNGGGHVVGNGMASSELGSSMSAPKAQSCGCEKEGHSCDQDDMSCGDHRKGDSSCGCSSMKKKKHH